MLKARRNSCCFTGEAETVTCWCWWMNPSSPADDTQTTRWVFLGILPPPMQHSGLLWGACVWWEGSEPAC